MSADIVIPQAVLAADRTVKKKYDELARLRTEQRDVAERAWQLRNQGLLEASDKDRDAYAAAWRAGKPDPGRTNTEKIERELTETERRADALGAALEEVACELDVLLDERADALRAKLAERAEPARESVRVAVDAAVAAFAELKGALAGQGWLNLPAGSKRAHIPEPVTSVRELSKPSGEPYRVAEILDALRHFAEPPAPPDPVEHAPRGTPWPVQGLRSA